MSTPQKPPAAAPVNQGDGGYREPLRSPVPKGTPVTSKFGPRKSPGGIGSTDHKGVDLGVSEGTAVTSAASGTVIAAGRAGGLGNSVRIRHDDQTETRYSHLSDINVKVGQKVVGGEPIGKSGSTGNATGPHLHYEVFKPDANGNLVQVNPLSKTTTIDPADRQKDAADTTRKEEVKQRQTAVAYNQDEIIQAMITGEHFKDNLANDYDNLTYHWRLFITADQAMDSRVTNEATIQSFYEEIRKFEQVTVAESGVTSYSIDEVTMEMITGTDHQTGSNLFTSIGMKITEPNGVNFLDALRNAALEVGVRNYQKCFYYLELSFKGYDQDGSVNLDPFTSLPNGGKWLWSVVINNIDVRLDAGGGSYNLDMVPLDHSLLVGQLNIVPASVSISGGTVGEFMDNLCTGLNNVWAHLKSGSNVIKFNTQFHPVTDVMTADEVRAMPISPKEEELNEERQIAFDANRTGHISQGVTISQVLDMIMGTSEKAQDLAKDSVNKFDTTDSAEKVNSTGYRQSIIWRIEPEVVFHDYDWLFNDYCKTITLHIYGFRHHAVVLSPIDTVTDAETQKAIIADMAKRDFLRKRYEYLFTGLNTEVLDLDLNFNLAWSAALPRLVEATQEQVAPHAKVDTTPKPDEQKRRDSKPQFDKNKVLSDQKKIADAEREAQNAYEAEARKGDKADPEKLKKLKVELDRMTAISKRAVAAVDKIRGRMNAERPAIGPGDQYDRKYGEELTRQQYELKEQEKKEAFPVTIENAETEIPGMAGQYHPGKSLYGAVLNQAYGPMMKQFQQIELSIRGDPYWIGSGSFEYAIARKSETWEGQARPNSSQGCPTILFKMRYPLGQDDNGDVIINTNETVTGVYQVNRVQHKFTDGKFTQVLKANRVVLVQAYTSLFKSIYPDSSNSPNDDEGAT